MKNIFIGLVILLAFVGGYFFFQKYNFKLEKKTFQENLVGNDLDEHGCKGSTGYSWCEIKQAMVNKYGWDPKNMIVTISKNNGRFTRGGMFLAVKRKGVWDIVFAGNGVPDCIKLKKTYLFPNEILIGVCD